MAIKEDITGLAVLIVCSVQSAPTTEIHPECKVTINQAHQYYCNPCGGPCLHLTRDSVMTQISNMAGRANKEITSYLNQSRTFIFQQTSPEFNHIDLPLFQKMDTFEETLKRTYMDLAIYFTFCMQVKQFEQNSNLQFSPPHFIQHIDMTLLHVMRNIAAGLPDAHFVAQIPVVSRHCLSTDLLRHQTQKQLIMKNLNSYFQSLRSFGLSA